MSESGLELLHHDIHTTVVCPGKWMEQQFHKNILKTSDILRQSLPHRHQRGSYNCSRCYTILHQNVPKKNHICPYKVPTSQ